MHPVTRAYQCPVVGVSLLIEVKKVDTKGGGKRRQRRVSRGKCSGSKTHHKHNPGHNGQVVKGNFRIKVIRRRHATHINSVLTGIDIQQCTDRQEKKIDNHENTRKGEHVLLRLADRFHTQVFLHQVLIKSRHRYRNENTAEEVLPEVNTVAH